jgi:acetyl-CoA carboxylase biotin carboxyl carrier protein
MIGTFYHASEQNVEAFVKVGDQVSEGDTLCIIEAMKMMNQIASDANGIIERILVQNGDPVEYGQVLFLISPD